MLIRHEGLRLKPYNDTVGKLTIGVGRNLDDVGISEREAMVLLSSDILQAKTSAAKIFWPEFESLNEARQSALIDMAFNLGEGKLRGFKSMIAAIKNGDFDSAAFHALDSKWATQVGHRANEIAEMLRTGEWQQ